MDWVYLTVEERVAKEMKESGCKQAIEQEIAKIHRSLKVIDTGDISESAHQAETAVLSVLSQNQAQIDSI